jgi:methionyl-tRNA formyltransferase
MRIVFMGTPGFAVPSLNALVAAGHDVCAVYSQPPRPAGRKMALTPSPVHERAEALGIPVLIPARLRGDAEQAEFAAWGADVAVVAAYGMILPQPILDAPALGCINVHASILPRWRGAAPIQRAILAGDAETGVTIMQMEAGLDTGPMRATLRTPVDRKTAGDLTGELARLGAALLVEVLADPDRHPPEAQPETGVTHAAKIDKSETHLDFLVSAPQVERQIRAFAPLAWFEHAGERIRIVAADVVPPGDPANGHPPATVVDDALTIACNPGAIRPTLVQRAGKAVMTSSELLRGYAIPPGTRLS